VASQAFLKESSHLDGSNETLTTVLSSQMFERFIEERIQSTNHPQVRCYVHALKLEYLCGLLTPRR
jgi:hypothetical protein